MSPLTLHSSRSCSARRMPSLPSRVFASCRARPGLMLGSTLHRGANCAQARRAGEVDGGVVVALVLRLAGLAAPVLRPANVLDVPTDMARLGGGKEAVGLHQCAPVPGALVAELPPRFPRAASKSPRRRLRAPGRPFCCNIPAASSPSTTITPWVLASSAVRLWIACCRTAATCAWRRVSFFAVSR